MKGLLLVLGLLTTGVGVAMIVAAFAVDEAFVGLLVGGVSLVLSGLALFGVMWLLHRLTRGAALGSGQTREGQPALAGQAVVTAVRDTGITVNTAAMFEVGLRVQLPGEAPYEATCRQLVARNDFGVLRPGVAVPVYVDPTDRTRVGIATGGAAAGGLAPAPGGAPASGTLVTPAGPVAVPGMTGAAQVTGQVSSADIVARGTKAEATVLSVAHSGKTLEELAPDQVRSVWQADDPLVVMTLQVAPPGRAPFVAQGLYRVPDGKAHALVVGTRVPVAFLAEDPATLTTVDWDAIPDRF